MATIQVNLEVNDEEFKQLYINNINDLPKDKMEELLLKAVEVSLIQDKNNPTYKQNSNILVTSERIHYGSGYSDYNWVPTDLMKEVLKKIDTAKYFEPIAEEIAAYMRDNYKDLIRKYMVDAIAKMLFTDNSKYNFTRDILDMINTR